MQYTIENEKMALTVNSTGAEAVALVKKADGAQLLWNGDKAVWPRHAPVLFPYVGKVKGCEIEIEGKVYPAPQHGFSRDLEHRVARQGESSITFELEASGETRKWFPYDFVLRNIYTLEGETLRHTIQVVNRDNRVLRFGVGYHPGFTCPFDDAHTTEDYVLRFDAPQTPVVVDNRPNGFVTDKRYELMQDSTDIPLTDHLFDEDSICMSGLTAKTLSLVEKDTGRRVTVDIEGYPYTLIWSMPTKPLQFVCIEPWRSVQDREDANGRWQDKPCAAALAPGESYETSLAMTFAR